MLVVECPKRNTDKAQGARESYEYYAGYSLHFAKRLLAHIPLGEDSVVLDPWNGSGTTTLAANELDIGSIGTDLNPVMVIVAKARLLHQNTLPSIEPLWEHIRQDACRVDLHPSDSEPLLDWFTPTTAHAFRRIEVAIRAHLVGHNSLSPPEPVALSTMSDLAAFFYLALFRVIRSLTEPFRSSNPTWLRRAKLDQEKIEISFHALLELVEADIAEEHLFRLGHQTLMTKTRCSSKLFLSSSEDLGLQNESVDVVLTSPPYCTRIDYAVATSAELAILGFSRRSTFAALRDRLMGTTTVPKEAPKILERWGSTCNALLDGIRTHGSVASDTYYLKNHLKYFSSLHQSIAEISRVLRHEGVASFVVQDSSYKNIHNDLPSIVSEMADSNGLVEFQRDEFTAGSSIGNINSKSRLYVPSGFKPTETVISFYKP